MEVVISWLFTLISIFLSLFLLNKILSSSKKLRLPPGPRKLPIIGNLHQLAAKTPLNRRLRELARVYGPIMHLRIGEVSTVVVSSAEAAREVMKTHDANFANRPKLIAGEILYNNFSDMALAPYGNYWRQLRKIATLELFTAKRVQSFRHVREEEVSKLIKSLASAAASESVVVNLSEKLFSLLFNITSRVVFSREGEGQKAFRVFLTNLSNIASGFSVADLYPSIKLLNSMSSMRRKLEKMVKESDTILDPIIDEHISKKRQRRGENDLVDVLLKFHEDNFEGYTDSSFSLTSNNIKAIILEIFGAGSDTSYATMEWAMLELLKHPSVMERVQGEVRNICQEKGTIDEGSLSQLKFLKLVVKETLRLHPPAPLLVPRESIEHCQIYGYDIPHNTRVMVNAWAIARDSKYWIDPNMFKPERFDGSSIDYMGTNFEFIPFGAGRRMCPGVKLGMVNVEHALAMLLYHFDWKLPIGIKPEDLDLDELFGITMRRKNELHVIPVPYTS